MFERQSETTQGKLIVFNVDKNYYIPGDDKEKVFGVFGNFKYAVAYTKVSHERGVRYEKRWGVYVSIPYDNGNVGYQNFDFFNDKGEALADFEDKSKLTPKYSSEHYTDVLFIENN